MANRTLFDVSELLRYLVKNQLLLTESYWVH